MSAEAEAETWALVAAEGAMLVVLFIPNLGVVFRCSIEAEGRSRVVLRGPAAPARLSLDSDGRSVVARGAGKRDIGRGRPLDLPAGAVLSSIVALGCLLDARSKSTKQTWGRVGKVQRCASFEKLVVRSAKFD